MAHDLSAANSRAISIRLPEEHYNHLVVVATRAGVSIAQALRLVLDRDIDRQPPIRNEDDPPGAPDSGAMDYRAFLALADFRLAITRLKGDQD